MNRINIGRVILGGLLAGLVINVSETVLNGVVLADDMAEAMTRMNLPQIGGGAIGVFVVMAFLLGIAMVWLYAAIRPRFGAGVSTALCAGSTVWFFAFFYPSVGFVIMGMFPLGTTVLALIWGLVELLAAAVAGAWLYRE